MVSGEDLAFIRERLQALAKPVKIDYFHQSSSDLLVPGRPPCPTCEPARQTLEGLAALSDQITLQTYLFYDEREMATKRGAERVPGTVVRGEVNRPLRYYGLPGGVFLPLLVHAIVAVSEKPPTPPAEVAAPLKRLRAPVHVRVVGSLRHPPSAQAALAAYGLGLASSKVQASVYDIEEFPELARQLKVDRLPLTIVNERSVFAGAAGSAALAQFCLDAQVNPLAPPPPEIAPGSVSPWQPPQPPAQPARGAAPRGTPSRPVAPPERRTPGGLILPG